MANFVRYLDYIVLGMLVPLLLTKYRFAGVPRRRELIAVAAGILAGTFAGFVSRLPGIAQAHYMNMGDPLPGFILAAASGTLLYRLGDVLLVRGTAAAPR